MNCRLCGVSAQECGGWLERVNELGVDGIWECRPSCASWLSEESKILGAIEGVGAVLGTIIDTASEYIVESLFDDEGE
jgi:hypothetical protein